MVVRLKNPAGIAPEIQSALVTLGTKINESGSVPEKTMELLHLRVSQLNGCAWCLHAGVKTAKKIGMSDEELIMVASWPEATVFSEEEKAALNLAEHMTRMSDQTDPVPDPVWDAVADVYDEKQLSILVTWIATTNLYNRLNVTTRQVPGTW